MTDKEKILAEIENELSLCAKDNPFDEGRWTALNHLKLFSECLPKEPESNDLEEEIHRYDNLVNPQGDKRIILHNVAEYFAAWGARRRAKQGVTIESHIRRNRYTKKNVLSIDVICDEVQQLKPGDVIIQIRNKED